MKKLEDYKGQKIAIYFPTYELWLRRREINSSDECSDNHWSVGDIKYYYYLPFNNKEVGDTATLTYVRNRNYTILPATDFLEEEFIYGKEYEFSDFKNFKIKQPGTLIYKSKDNRFVSWNGGCAITYSYCRKINTERTEAITTIKELVSKFSINQNEVF